MNLKHLIAGMILTSIVLPALGDQQFEAIQNAMLPCKEEAKSAKYDAIRGKVPLYGDDVTPAMLQLTRKPTPIEVTALQKLVDMTVRCGQTLARAYGESPKSALDLAEWPTGQVAGLSLLITGYATYADFAVNTADRLERMTKDLEARFANQAAVNAVRQQTLLVCTAESPELARGLEIQYQIDPAQNSVRSSRGPAVPSNVRISDGEVTFDSGDQRVSISRISGTFSIFAGAVRISGRCAKASSQVF